MTTQPVTQIPQNHSADPKHTPGPWWFSEDVDNQFKVGQGDVSIATVHPPKLENGAKYGFFDPGDPRDNARLIAQAPEMFTCILSMLRWYSNRLNGHDISPYEKQPPEIQRAMRVYKSITGENYK